MNQIKQLIKERGITALEFQELGGFSRATYFNILNGSRKLSKLELLGLQSLPKKRGRKPKETK